MQGNPQGQLIAWIFCNSTKVSNSKSAKIFFQMYIPCSQTLNIMAICREGERAENTEVLIPEVLNLF